MVVLVALGCVAYRDPEPRFETPAPDHVTKAASGPTQPSPEEFVTLFTRAVRRIDPTVRVVALDHMRVAGRREGAELPFKQLTLENAWGECRPAPDSCPQLIEHFAHVFLNEDHEAPSLETLRLALTGIEIRRRQPTGPEFELQPFAGDLVSCFVRDSTDAITNVSLSDLAALGLPPNELRERALSNMRQAFGPLRQAPIQGGSPVHAVVTSAGGIASDSYDNARLLLPERWQPLRAVVHGDLVAATPARDEAVFTGTEEPRGIDMLTYLATEMWQREPHPVSPQLARLTDDGWVPYGTPHFE